MPPKTNYLNNRDILSEIHKSKNSYCYFVKQEYNQYDIIIHELSEITDELIEEARRNHSKRKSYEIFDALRSAGEQVKLSECDQDINTISKYDLTFRLMSFDHIPLNPHRKKNAKTIADRHERINFPPFQHYKFNDNDQLECVGKSHWKGDLTSGSFCKTHGQLTNKLCLMYIKLCERYATRGNVRSYSYNDEMRGQAILQLTQIGLQFDESKSSNPFSYLTACVTNSFVKVINIEKRNQLIRDELLEMNGLNPSHTRTNSDDGSHLQQLSYSE